MAEPTLQASLREQLQQERDRLVGQLRGLGHGPDGRIEVDYDENFADSGQVTAERGEVEALAGSLTETLAEVDEALAKLDAGTYGTCASCGAQIAPARLEAMPTASLCIRCASSRR